ncbi:MAG: hypothetical protein JO036_21900 [Candidatus Eremiobacteraeota bacterium]|nr:hypothetical protein [Candidatus Eremiobacteraeota bacterium]
MAVTEPKALAAAHWFGYGRWDAPYWFIGKEPGGADDPEQYASWQRLGGNELIDCNDHDRDCAAGGPGLWHGPEPGPNLQPTWRPLIAMTLAFEGAQTWDAHAARRYQDERWGRTEGDTAVLELSAVAAKSVAHGEAMRLLHLPERIATLRAHLARTPPRFVVFYGLGTDPVHNVPYLHHWREIAQADLEVDQPVRVGETAFVVEKHPTAHGTTTQHWMDLGRRVHKMLDAGGMT